MNGLQSPHQWLSWRWKQQGVPVAAIKMETSTLTKQGQRFLTKLTTSSAATDNLIRRFVQGSPKSVVLTTLSHLLSPTTSYPQLSTLALPVSTILSANLIFFFLIGPLTGLAKKIAALRESQPSPVVHLELHHRGRTRRAPPQTRPPGPIRSPDFRGHFQATISQTRTRCLLRQTRGSVLQTKVRNRLRCGLRLPRQSSPHIGIGARETQGLRVHGEWAVFHGQAP